MQQPKDRSEGSLAPGFIVNCVDTAFEIFVMDDLGCGPVAGQVRGVLRLADSATAIMEGKMIDCAAGISDSSTSA
eukprot:921193-Pyramimonas_sp.AAC.1